MHAPAEIQRRLRRSILVALDGDLAGIVKGGDLSPERRIGVHRNHFQISLAQALSATFPATRAVVGNDFFEQVALAFALEYPPTGPCLFEYGADLPGYLDRLPALRELPYLGDLAQFEWQVNAVHHAPDHGVFEPTALAGLSPDATASLRFISVPSVRLFASRFPILKIRQLARGETSDDVSLDAGGVRLLIRRRADRVVWREMAEMEYAFAAALLAGETLAEAALSELDLAAAFATLLRDGVLLSTKK